MTTARIATDYRHRIATGIVDIGEDEGRAYRTTESGPDHRATFATHASDLAAVFATPDAGGIAVLHRSGLLRFCCLR
ncbi:MAG: hypothetical protein AB7K09_10745 [Planctomycetota bacterium]